MSFQINDIVILSESEESLKEIVLTDIKMDKKVLLMILDGWGEGRQDESNVIYTQGAPYIEGLRKQYPMSTLKACGEAVGLPDGQMGNSEVVTSTSAQAAWCTRTS